MTRELVKILDLNCCQMALGMLEVKQKAKEFEKLSKEEFLKESKKDPLKVIVGPNKKLYLVDGHHRALAGWLTGHKKMYMQRIGDFSKKKISKSEFWKILRKKQCVHLYDQFGAGPHEPLYLPVDVRGLGDDPYRSLAWLAKEDGAFKDSKDRFSDFKWANFFREKKLLHGRSRKDFKQAKKKALNISHHWAAKNLPGFVSHDRS